MNKLTKGYVYNATTKDEIFVMNGKGNIVADFAAGQVIEICRVKCRIKRIQASTMPSADFNLIVELA